MAATFRHACIVHSCSPDKTWTRPRRPIGCCWTSCAGPEQRSAIASALTNHAIEGARAGIARAHPDMSALEQQVIFVEVHYGAELAGRLREFLGRRSAGEPS